MNATLTDHDAILRAVLDEPGEDLHRLAYADWLEERGGPTDATRAEFIRVQLEAAGLETAGASRFEPPLLRAHELEALLLTRDGYLWLQKWLREVGVFAGEACMGRRKFWARGGAVLEPGGVGGRAMLGVLWRRGFVEELSLTCADFVAHAGALFAAQPVAKVTLTDHHPMAGYSGVGGPITGWGWGPESDDYDHAGVPAPLYSLLTGFWRREQAWKVYPAQPDALSALSAACVLYGRAEARRRRR